MNIFKKLAELADALDKKGLYAEASEIDEIIKNSEGFDDIGTWPAPGEPIMLGEPEILETGVGSKSNITEQAKVGKIQERFNRLYDQLSKYNTSEQMRLMFGDKLVVDRAWGPKTEAAHSKLRQMSDMLKWEIAKKQQPEMEVGMAEQTPVINKNIAPTDQEIMREVNKLSGEVKAAGGTPLDLHNMIKEVKYLMNEGKDLRGALDELRMRMMGA